MAQVVAQLAATGSDTHQAGQLDSVGIAITDPKAADETAADLAATLGTRT